MLQPSTISSSIYFKTIFSFFLLPIAVLWIYSCFNPSSSYPCCGKREDNDNNKLAGGDDDDDYEVRRLNRAIAALLLRT